MASGKKWWTKRHRIIQTNLQVDQANMDPERLVSQLKEMNANGLAFNVGGIYAWYDTKVQYHTKNPYLLEDYDLVGTVIDLCHKNDIRFIARFDFSKAEDKTYYQRPEWFIRQEDKKPLVVAPDRPGAWPLLMSTCTNGGYQKEGVGYPVIKEAMSKYDMDGIFINSMFYAPCTCDACSEKYKNLYGQELPAEPWMCDPKWYDACADDSLRGYHELIKSINPDTAFFHRYMMWQDLNSREMYKATKWWFYDQGEYDIFFSHPQDIVHAETHDMLNMGAGHLPEEWAPAANMNLGAALSPESPPMDIVHTAPGMIWRHVGISPAEHLFWISQVAANGGYVWHSMTGIPDGQYDKRMLDTITEYNGMAKKLEPFMEGAVSTAQAALLWNSKSGFGWIEALINNQIPFSFVLARQATIEKLSEYLVVIIPENTLWSDELIDALQEYVNNGGSIILEGQVPDEYKRIYEFAGVKVVGHGEKMGAAYIRLEEAANTINKDLEKTQLIPFNGSVIYEKADEETKVLCTLVPPFSPPEGVGSPPERAMLFCEKTDTPMLTLRARDQGKVVNIPFSFNTMLKTYKIEEHYLFISNIISNLMGGQKNIAISRMPGIQLTCFRKDNTLLVHLVNGIGKRPLRRTISAHDIDIDVLLDDGKEAKKAEALIGDGEIKYSQQKNKLHIHLDKIATYEVVLIEW